MCGTRLKNGWVLLGLLLLALPGYSWAGDLVPGNSVEKQNDWVRVPRSELVELSKDIEILEKESIQLNLDLMKANSSVKKQKTVISKLENKLKEVNLELSELKTQLAEQEKDSTKSLDEVKESNRLNNKIFAVAIPTGIGIFLIGGLIGGLIHSAIQ